MTSSRPPSPAASWVLLAYRIPREPSTPRISVWRKLRQLGAAQIVDGLVALPAEARTREHFTWLAEEIREASGDAWIWESSLTSRAQERALVQTMTREVTAEYEELAGKAAALRQGEEAGARALSRLRRELHRIEAKDYFGAPARKDAVRALERLAAEFDGAKR